jgi:predicted RNA-binding protein YlqC (UPF0109 family)
MAPEQDQEFVEYVLKTVVDNPDDVQVERTIDEMGVLITVTVNPEDMGKVIGKSGQTAKAIRTLLKVVGAKHDARVNMKIIEPEGGRPQPTDDAPAQDDTAQDNAAPTNDAPVVGDEPVQDDQPVQQGTTDATDDVPLDETSEVEAAVEQQQSDAAVNEPPNENNSAVDESTGDYTPEQQSGDSTTEEAQQPDREDVLAKERERTPLDEL